MSEQQKEQQLLETVDRIIAEGPYQPAWSSLMQAKTPDWFKQKRFGIFIHWGVYSVPANSNEWYPRNMYIEGMPAYEHHIKIIQKRQDISNFQNKYLTTLFVSVYEKYLEIHNQLPRVPMLLYKNIVT